MAIKKVWIKEGCTVCGLCEMECPDVFELGDDTAEIKEGADLESNEDCIRDAADACPVDVIGYDEG